MTKRRKNGKAGAYRILRGVSWRVGDKWKNVEADPKKLRTDLPPEHVAGWIEIGAIEPAEES